MRVFLMVMLLSPYLIHAGNVSYSEIIDKLRFYDLDNMNLENLDSFTKEMVSWQVEFLKSYDVFDERFSSIATEQLPENAPVLGAFFYHINRGDYVFFRDLNGTIEAREEYLRALYIAEQEQSNPLICEVAKRILQVNRYSYLEDNATGEFYLELLKNHAYDEYERFNHMYLELLLAFQHYRMENWNAKSAHELEGFTSRNSVHFTNALILQLLSTYYHQKNENEIAVDYQLRALDYLNKIKYGYKSTTEKVSKIALIRYYLTMSESDLAQKVLFSIDPYHRNQQEKSFVSYVYYYQSVVDSLKGNYAAAFRNLGEYTSRISVANNDINRIRFEELEAKYQTEQKENEILRQQNRISEQNSQMIILYSVIGFIGILGVVSVLFFEQRKKTIKFKADKKIEDLINDQELKTAYATLEGQDKERQRIAAELHDNLGSILVTINMYADALTKSEHQERSEILKKISETSAQATDEIRKISHSLDSGMLKHFGLTSAIHQLMEAIESTKNISTEVMADLEEHPDYDTSLELYRMVQELVNNTLKHSGASEITVKLKRIENHLILSYKDNGRGFDQNKISRGLGLNNLEKRANRLGAELSILSAPNDGCTVIVKLSGNEPGD